MRILLGYDGSKNAKLALARATEMTKTSDSDLMIVVVASVPNPAPYAQRSYYEELHSEKIERSQNLLAEALEMAKAAGVAKVSGMVKEGFPAETIVSHASEKKADMIVVGRRGIRGVERKLIGSVSSSVLAQSKCDVLVVVEE